MILHLVFILFHLNEQQKLALIGIRERVAMSPVSEEGCVLNHPNLQNKTAIAFPNFLKKKTTFHIVIVCYLKCFVQKLFSTQI
jgi:hypothetical protein